MIFIQQKNLFSYSSQFFIGAIICALMLAPLSNAFANTVPCVDDALSPMEMMGDKAMADMDCCTDIEICTTSCDLSMFSASALLDSTSLVPIGKQVSGFSSRSMDYIPFVPPPPLIRPPVSV